ncbi:MULTISPECIES: ABC-2 transporter permease [unclassified Bacillus cereus group]|uniref:ABC-2 transporter permease n=1 Tax=unclassified Bacillus cereus group TaxID=2750818 RepID=UPI001F569F39|nr:MULTISPECIES: ABC-2 transporter permease [unclassified Bacillus cereus group]
MQQLILKDIFLQRTIFLICFIFPFYGMLKQSIEPHQLASICFATCLFMISFSIVTEEKNSTEKILVSLPCTRKEIVIAKYISTAFFIVATLIVTFVLLIVPVLLFRDHINIPWYALFVAGFFSILYAAMILPMKYSGNKQMVTILGIMVLFPILGLQGFMCNVFAEERLMVMFFQSSNVMLVISILSIVAWMSYFISMFVSIIIFKQREL